MQITITQGLPEGGRQIRLSVFVQEQGFSESLEFDGIDDTPWHAVLWDKGIPVATGRLFPGEEELSYTIGRVAVRKERRGDRLGSQVVSALEEKARSLGGNQSVLCAQVRAQGFYESLGYRSWGGELFDEGVPHVMMRKKL